MKPVHVFALLVSGALGGALLMRVVHPGKPIVPTVAQSRPPATAPPEAVVPEPVVQAPPASPAAAPPEPVADVAPVDAPPAVKSEVKAEAKAEPKPAKPSPMPPVAKPPVRQTAKLYPFHNVPPLSPQPVIPPSVEYTSPTPTPPPAIDPQPEPSVPDPGPLLPEATAVPVPQPHQVTLNAGFILPVRLVEGLSSERNVPGDTFLATLARELVAGGFIIAERGARVEGRVMAVDRARAHSAALALELTRLYTSDGQRVTIQTEGFFKHSNQPEISNAGKIAGGALLGAAIGALAGGGKGAAIGAGIGGGAGIGDVLLLRRPAEMASETLVTFRLKLPVPLTEHLR